MIPSPFATHQKPRLMAGTWRLARYYRPPRFVLQFPHNANVSILHYVKQDTSRYSLCNTHCNTNCNTHCNTPCQIHCNTRRKIRQGGVSESPIYMYYIISWHEHILHVGCNTSQHTLQHNATYTTAHYNVHCYILQHTAEHGSTQQHTATHGNTLRQSATHCNTLQHTATNCNTLQHTATHCNKLQHTTT